MVYDGKYGNLIQTKDINSLVTTFIYDEFGRSKKTEFPDGTIRLLSLEWDNNGSHNNALFHVTSEASGYQPRKTYYDFLNRPVQNIYSGFNGELREDIEYNNLGLLERRSEPYYFQPSSIINWVNYSYNDVLFRCSDIVSPSVDQTYEYNGSSTVIINNKTSVKLIVI